DVAEIVPFDIDGLASGDVTSGHRFMAPAPIAVRRYDDYADALQKAKVVLDADRRKAIILADAKSLAFAQGLQLVEDEGLLEEVAGLVEWPVVLMGEFGEDFLDIPPEVIRATIGAGNGRVVRARLSDARHFWLTDLHDLPDYKDKAEKPLGQRLAKLEAL